MTEFQVDDIVIVEDPPTGVAMHAKGRVIAVRADGFITVRIEGIDYSIWHQDLRLRAKP